MKVKSGKDFVPCYFKLCNHFKQILYCTIMFSNNFYTFSFC